MADTDNCIRFSKLSADATMPRRGTPESAGFDLYAADDTLICPAMGMIAVPTNIAVQLPAGTYGRIAARSGLACKHHLAVGAGVIDADYTGEIIVLIYCVRQKHEPYVIKKGERFAQLIVEKICTYPCVEVAAPPPSSHAGFGSTGTM
jgi:deoxyuridine 5'-triphosphate nucleotidohydrolase